MGEEVVSGHIMEHFRYLQLRGPPQGYFPEPTNSISAVALRNVERAKEFFRGTGINIFTCSWYLGGFVCERASKESWLAAKVQGWTEFVITLSGVARNHLKFAYAGLQKSIQHEWEFLQRVTLCIGDAFGPVEQALWETSYRPSSRAWEMEHQGKGSPAYL